MIGYNLGFPFAVVGEVKEYWRVTATQVPSNFGLLFSDEGPPISFDGYGRVSISLERNNVTSYTPWIPVNIVPLVIPKPDVAPQVTIGLAVHQTPGVVLQVVLIQI